MQDIDGGGTPDTGTISGPVTDAANARALQGVAVTATVGAAGGAVLATATTDASGRCSLTVPVGGCSLHFSKANDTFLDGADLSGAIWTVGRECA